MLILYKSGNACWDGGKNRWDARDILEQPIHEGVILLCVCVMVGWAGSHTVCLDGGGYRNRRRGTKSGRAQLDEETIEGVFKKSKNLDLNKSNLIFF